MSLFVHFDNQTILWETIQKHPHISVIPTNERTTWFKNHIRTIYEKIPTTWFQSPLSTENLNELNQTTLRQMMQDLQQNFHHNHTNVPISDQLYEAEQRKGTINMLGIPPTIVPQIRKEQVIDTHQLFQEKKQEMESLLHLQPPKNVEFKITEIDEPITNMEELVQRQLRQRELDIPTMDPSGSLQPSYVPLQMEPVKQTSEKISASEQARAPNGLLSIHPENVQINVLDLSKKKVIFDLPALDDSESHTQHSVIYEQIFTRIQQLEEKIDKIMDLLEPTVPVKPPLSNEDTDLRKRS